MTDRSVVCHPLPDEAIAGPVAGQAAASEVVCVQADVPCRLLVAVAPREPWSVPVVDDRGRFLGFVFSRQLAPRAAARGPGILGTIAAQDLTSGTILAVHEGTAVSTALRLMAHHGCRVLALVDDEGVLRGALSDVEALGALRRA